jgi:hypothetical protein
MKVSGLGLGLAAALLSVWPASAGAAPLDVASGGVALSAYHTYMSALVSDLPASQQRADAFVASISASCPNALAAVSGVPANPASPVSPVNQSATFMFGEEVGLDAALEVGDPSTAPLAALDRTLAGLRWSSLRTAAKIKRFLKAKRALLTLPASDLCGDARALVSANAQVTPPGTLAFVATAKRDAAAASAGNSAFVKILNRFHTRAEHTTVAATNRLVRKLKSAYTTLSTTEAHELLPVLGLREKTG